MWLVYHLFKAVIHILIFYLLVLIIWIVVWLVLVFLFLCLWYLKYICHVSFSQIAQVVKLTSKSYVQAQKCFLYFVAAPLVDFQFTYLCKEVFDADRQNFVIYKLFMYLNGLHGCLMNVLWMKFAMILIARPQENIQEIINQK